MKKIVREVSEIELNYITKVLTDDNVNVEKVIVHSVTESPTGTKYSVEVHHDEQCTIFNANKQEIDDMFLPQKELTSEEIYQIINKAVNVCKVLYKYRENIVPFIVECGIFTFVIQRTLLTVCKTKPTQDKDYYLNKRPSLLFSPFEVQILGSQNYSKIDRIFNNGIRLTHDATQFNCGASSYDNIDIDYFHEPNKGDYFSFSTVNDLSKESYEEMCNLYEVLNSIKYTEYKIKIEDDNRMKSSNVSHFRKSCKEFLKFDLEKHILDEIEREYADYIKVP